jgi:hypothetical protein
MLLASASLMAQSLAGADAAPSADEPLLAQATEPVDSGAASVTRSAAYGSLRGVIQDSHGAPLAAVSVAIQSAGQTRHSLLSGDDGSFVINDLDPGSYQLIASKEGFAQSTANVQIAERQTVLATLALATASAGIVPLAAEAPSGSGHGFFYRWAKAYWDDWHPSASAGTDPAPAFRGFPAPESSPPYPFTVWPYGGSVVIGQPWTQAGPLMTAIWSSKHGDWWKKSRIQMYGWSDFGMNLSTSTQAVGGKYANAPAAYNQIPNSIQLDQFAFYIERQPDTVQTDHFDWGFRFTGLYGFDYRFTTANGYFSQQLLNNPKADGTIGNAYGFDPVMAYIDLYFPHVFQGMNLRLGRYVSLPDIEAQLAPNNYTYTHSLLYVYDCYTQTGANATIKLSNHWMIQLGLSPGCDTAAWRKGAELTGNACGIYTWRTGADNIYVCGNSLNNGRYGYNNLAAYYFTWFHKFNSNWHTGTESWYQYESHTPNIFNPAAASLIETNANGAWCDNPTELTCFAPEWAILNYTNRQLGKRDFISLRNEFFDDLKGQRTGFKTRYVESGLSWNHWIGSTVTLRPELRWERALDYPAYDGGHRQNQLMFAADFLWFF